MDNFKHAEAVTPNDSADLPNEADALYVGTSGHIKVDTAAGDTVTFNSVPKGILRVAVSRVYDTDTTASTVIALWN